MEQNSIFSELWVKFKNPWKHTSFKIYFVLFVLLFGGLDIYYSLEEQCRLNWVQPWEVAKNMAAYGLTMIGASAVELVLSPDFQNKKSMTYLAFFTALVALLLFHNAYYMQTKFSLILAGINVVIGLIFWIVANTDNANLKEDPYLQEMKEETKLHGQSWE